MNLSLGLPDLLRLKRGQKDVVKTAKYLLTFLTYKYLFLQIIFNTMIRSKLKIFADDWRHL